MFSQGYKRYALVAMTTVYTVSLFDRGAITLLLQPIKEDLHLSDTQLGFVTGIAFGLFYVVMGIPIARWADRGNRVTICSLAIGLWSLTVMTYLFVTNYAQLLLARILAGIGDSGVQPPTYSLLGDYFPKAAERTRAMYLWNLSSSISGLLSFTAAGWLSEHYGWRLTFFLLGIPGLVLAVVFRLTVVEPRRHTSVSVKRSQTPPRFSEVLSVLWRQRSCRHLLIATIVYYTMGSGLAPFYLAFMMRSHDMSATQLGFWMGLVAGPCVIASMLVGAFVVGRWFASNERAQLQLNAASAVLSVPCLLMFLLAPDRHLAFVGLILTTGLMFAFSSPIYAILQRLVPDGMRATIFATVLTFANIIGIGIGPQLVGILSDAFTPRFGVDGLRYAMLTVSFMAAWAGYHYWRVGRTVKEDIAATSSFSATSQELPQFSG